MKRFWVAMFSMGFVLALGATASAADAVWGTPFNDSLWASPQIRWQNRFGPVLLGGALATKNADYSKTSLTKATGSDRDRDAYVAYGIFMFQKGHLGFLAKYIRGAQYRETGLPLYGIAPFKTNAYFLAPTARLKFGPVAVDTELIYGFGKQYEFESGSGSAMPDVRVDQLAAYLNLVADFGMLYVGGTLAYVFGDDPGSTDKAEGGLINGGTEWNPCLIMWNYDRTYWTGVLPGFNVSVQTSPMSNAWFFQGKTGVRPVANLDIMASVSFANADKKPSAAWLYNAYGCEVDVTGTYKITHNLSYMLGLGYLLTGNYYKGTGESNKVGNDYIVINKLSLNF